MEQGADLIWSLSSYYAAALFLLLIAVGLVAFGTLMMLSWPVLMLWRLVVRFTINKSTSRN